MKEDSHLPNVYLVDDDPIVLRAVQGLLERQEYSVATFTSAEELLASVPSDAVGCVVTDLKMPGMNGQSLQRRLLSTHPSLAVVVITGAADVRTAVEVMESGAVTLIEKPIMPAALISAVEKAIELSGHRSRNLLTETGIRNRLSTLSDDERQVMRLMIQGLPNKRIVMELHLSSRTVDRRRAAVLNKMHVASVPELAALLSHIPDW